MPLVVKEFPRPEPWAEFRRKAFHPIFVPLLYCEWIFQWCAFLLSRWSLLEVLEYAGRFSILIAVIFYFAETGQRTQARHYQAWQVINTAQGKGGNGGRIEALSQLNDDHVSLVGVDVSDAFLQNVRLDEANLRRAIFSSADMREAHLHRANLADADLVFTNLENADLSEANLFRADLRESDLSGADLAGIRNWRDIHNFFKASFDGVRNAPEGFLEWAKIQVKIDTDAQPAGTRPAM